MSPATIRRTSPRVRARPTSRPTPRRCASDRSEEHTSELQSQSNLVCRLLLERLSPAQGTRSTPTRRSSDLQDMNTVRKHLSAIAGGQLAAATKAPVVALIISDVTGDDPTHIASGPCAPDQSTYAEAMCVG